jgi:bifunctional non-homologous end joining protein LigD
MRLRLVEEPFDHADYIFELKRDGFRAVSYIQNVECKLISRNQNNLRFTSLKQAIATLPVQNAITDGDGRGWIKIKNRAYTQAEERHELLVRK